MDEGYQTFVGDDSEKGDSRVGTNKRAMYEPSGMDRVRHAILSPKKACIIAVGCFLGILSIALIAAFARPFVSCPCNRTDEATLGNGNDTSNQSPTLAPATNGEPFPWNSIRLPEFIVPVHYSIYIHPNFTTFKYQGGVNITFKLLQSANFVVLHIKEIQLDSAKLISDEDNRIVKELEHEKHEQLYMEFSQNLKPNKHYNLQLNFTGNLTEKLEGFYLSSYTTISGEKRYLATTHFEPTYARSAFPCFDEPLMKATFKMSIAHDDKRFSLFNTPVQRSERLTSGLIIDHFNVTVQMSTYLVAFVVCDYKNITSFTKRGVQVSVFSPPDQIYQAQFASDISTAVLDFYEDFFGIPYPLPKQDLIAIPDFGAGAMENWGLTTYRETAILADFNETAIIKQQQVAMTVSHELAHQWFGNLVTMKWWNDLWLNEGFASFVEYLGAEYVRPEWKMMDQFVIENTQPALQLDSLPSSHPISVKVDDPSEIESIFDTISYSKGAAIIYMLESFLGKPTLKKGLKRYLSKFKYANAETEDLWKVLSEESQESHVLNATIDVKAVMDTWTQQMGFPLITIHRSGDYIYATQERFLVGIRPEEDYIPSEFVSNYRYKWHVPLTYITDKSLSEPKLVWMERNDAKFQVDKSVQWIKCNVNQTGFYRVTYDPDMWHKLVSALQTNHTMFSAADRASLLDDAFTLAKNNRLSPIIPLNMTNYLFKERDYIPWVTTLDHLTALKILLHERPAYIYFKKYAQKLLDPIVNFVQWSDSGTHLERLLRPTVLYDAATYNNEMVIKEAKRLFDDWKTLNISIPPNLRGVVYMVGIEHGTYDDWIFCWNHYQSTHLPSEKHTLLIALGASRDPWILSQFLEYSLQKEKVRPQNTYLVLRSVSYNPIGRDMVWRFVRSNWKILNELFGEGSFATSNIILETTSQFVTRFDYDEVQAFFENRDVGSGKRAVKSSLEKIQTSIEWLENNEKTVETWLHNQVLNP